MRASSILLDSVPLHADISGFVAMKQRAFPSEQCGVVMPRIAEVAARARQEEVSRQVLRGVTRFVSPY